MRNASAAGLKSRPKLDPWSAIGVPSAAFTSAATNVACPRSGSRVYLRPAVPSLPTAQSLPSTGRKSIPINDSPASRPDTSTLVSMSPGLAAEKLTILLWPVKP